MSVELWNSRARITPADLLRSLAEECEKLNVHSCDVYGDFEASPDQSYLRRFEREISSTFGKEDALFLPSGVMAQQIALLTHYHAAVARGQAAQKAFVCHYSSHILLHEKDTCSNLLNMQPLIVEQQQNTTDQKPLSFSDVTSKIQPDASGAVPSAVVLECPHREIGGKCTPYSDLEKISQLCRGAGVAFHMDGARLWEAIAYYTTCTTASGQAVTALDLCSLFDSIYVSCYKGIGGMTGAVLLGNAPFIAEARVWLRRFGGNVFTLLPYAVSSYACYRQYLAWNTAVPENVTSADSGAVDRALPVPYSMQARRLRMQQVVALLTATPALQNFVRFDPPVPQVPLVHVYVRADVATALAAHEQSRQETGIACFARLRPSCAVVGSDASTFPVECFFEFNMGIMNGAISDADWVAGWTAFVRVLAEQQQRD